MTLAADAVPPAPKRVNLRPSAVRRWAALYLDLLSAAWFAWMVCHSAGVPALFPSLSVLIATGQILWSRHSLRPTLGEAFLGIRCLTSSSNQVVADIRILHPTLILNAPLLAAGIVEITLAAAALSGWTWVPGSVLAGQRLDAPASLAPWLLWGVLLFVGAGSILSASPKAPVRVAMIHAFLCAESLVSGAAWESVAAGSLSGPWADRVDPASLIRGLQVLFLLWSVVLILALLASRAVLKNAGRGRNA